MLNFDFSLPTKVLFGHDAENLIPDMIQKNGFKKVLLHSYDEAAVENIQVYAKVKGLLEALVLNTLRCWACSPIPPWALLERALRCAGKRAWISSLPSAGKRN